MPTFDPSFLPEWRPPMSVRPFSPWTFDFGRMSTAVAAVIVHAGVQHEEMPQHRHVQGQLAMVLEGSMTCEVPGAMWMAPVHGGLWIPGATPHGNRVAPNSRVCFLFLGVEMDALPRHCCTVGISPLLRELALHLAGLPHERQHGVQAGRLRAVLLDQLETVATGPLHLPMSAEPRVRRMAQALTADPADRSTAAQWASRLAVSERTFARLVRAETGMSFGHWRHRLQVMVALQWLSSGATVQQVAADLGYNSVNAFISMFKKSMGVPPGRYLAQRHARPAQAPKADN